MSEREDKKAVSGRFYYDAAVVMRNVPEIMGMGDLVMKGRQWQGPYRLCGERCGHRRDKLKVFVTRGVVCVKEEGEPAMSLQRWLVEYGGCADYRHAGRVLRGADPSARIAELMARGLDTDSARGLYVPEAEWEACRALGMDGCAMYGYLCRLFGESEALRVLDLYRVTADSRGDMVYWYVDVEGRICHDKVMRYRHDGHRDKGFGGFRRFTTAKGYTNRCYYGSHLLDGEGERRVMVVEGEKTALLCAAVWPWLTFIATGGKSQLRDTERGWTLLPDVDAAEEWGGRGAAVSRWWEAWDGCGERSDVGDMVEGLVRAGRLAGLREEGMMEKIFNNL